MPAYCLEHRPARTSEKVLSCSPRMKGRLAGPSPLAPCRGGSTLARALGDLPAAVYVNPALAYRPSICLFLRQLPTAPLAGRVRGPLSEKAPQGRCRTAPPRAGGRGGRESRLPMTPSECERLHKRTHSRRKGRAGCGRRRLGDLRLSKLGPFWKAPHACRHALEGLHPGGGGPGAGGRLSGGLS